MKNSSKKVMFVIVEGISDQTALSVILSDLIANDRVIVEIMNGDITTKQGINPQNIAAKIGNFINNYNRSYSLKATDYLEVVHIIDMDGAYINDDKIIKIESDKAIYYNDRIGIDKPFKIIERNKQKRNNINKLLTLNKVCKSIPYSVYFFSCNLDHVLYGNANLPKEEKVQKANCFAIKYEGDIKGFLTFIHTPELISKNDYTGSWEYIREENNSLHRCTNINVFLSPEAKVIKRTFEF